MLHRCLFTQSDSVNKRFIVGMLALEQHRQEGGKKVGRKILASLLLWKELSD